MLSKKEVDTTIEDKWEGILSFKNENDELEHDTQMLMFTFLSEIEKYQELDNINKKELAYKIKTSPSYITQLFRGNKPLNFETIAKIQKALNIRFKVRAISSSNEMSINVYPFAFESTVFSTMVNGSATSLTSIKGGQYNDSSFQMPISKP